MVVALHVLSRVRYDFRGEVDLPIVDRAFAAQHASVSTVERTR